MVAGCVEVTDVDSGVYTPEERFPKLSPHSAPSGIDRVELENVSFVSAFGEAGEQGWDWGTVGNLENVKLGTRKEK